MRYLFFSTVVLALFAAGFLALQGGEAAEAKLPQGAIVLRADDNDYHDPAWEQRHYYGKATWGIRGSGSAESGGMGFDSFPGPSGRYRVSMGIIAEQDGSPFYKVFAGEQLLANGRFPYPEGGRDCDARGRPLTLDLGVHSLKKGTPVRVWGKSVYECGSKGAYTLWHHLVFEPVGEGA